MKFCQWILAAWLCLFASGCSTFNYEWRQVAKHPTPTNDISGRWEGRWISKSNGHNDRMRCLITRVDDQHYRAKFHAAYKKWITVYFGYTVQLQATHSTNGVTFQGAEDLGPLAGGIYKYVGHATPTNFFSTYDSKYDKGTFQMQRPKQ